MVCMVVPPISYAKTITSGGMALGGRTSGRYLEQEGRTLMVGIIKTLMIGSYERDSRGHLAPPTI